MIWLWSTYIHNNVNGNTIVQSAILKSNTTVYLQEGDNIIVVEVVRNRVSEQKIV